MLDLWGQGVGLQEEKTTPYLYQVQTYFSCIKANHVLPAPPPRLTGSGARQGGRAGAWREPRGSEAVLPDTQSHLPEARDVEMYLLPVQGHAGPHGQCPTESQGHAHDQLHRLRGLLSRLQLGPRATGGGCPRPVDGHSRAVTKGWVGKWWV